MESKELIIALVTILGSGAAFKFYEMVIKTKKEAARELRQEEKADNPETMFRDDLLKRVNEMSTSLETAQGEILRLTQKVAELETENRYLQREIDIIKKRLMNDTDFGFSNDFEDFVDEMTNDQANDKACSIDNPDCEACGS